jgi:hypothetical protein
MNSKAKLCNDSIKLHNNPEIFFSSKELKNVKIHKLISVGKFGKVKFITFFRLFNLTKF